MIWTKVGEAAKIEDVKFRRGIHYEFTFKTISHIDNGVNHYFSDDLWSRLCLQGIDTPIVPEQIFNIINDVGNGVLILL